MFQEDNVSFNNNESDSESYGDTSNRLYSCITCGTSTGCYREYETHLFKCRVPVLRLQRLKTTDYRGDTVVPLRKKRGRPKKVVAKHKSQSDHLEGQRVDTTLESKGKRPPLLVKIRRMSTPNCDDSKQEFEIKAEPADTAEKEDVKTNFETPNRLTSEDDFKEESLSGDVDESSEPQPGDQHQPSPDPQGIVAQEKNEGSGEDTTRDSGVNSPALQSPSNADQIPTGEFSPNYEVESPALSDISNMSGTTVEACSSLNKTMPQDEEKSEAEPQLEQETPTPGHSLGISLRPQAELLAPTQEPFSALQGLVSDIQANEGLKVCSPVDAGALSGPGMRCLVCGLILHSPQALEHHRNQAAHWVCADCPDGGTFTTSSHLAAHIRAEHPQGASRLSGVSVYPSLHNPPYSSSTVRQNNHITISTPQLGPGVILTSSGNTGMSSTQQLNTLPNLPPGVHVSKRPAQQPSPPHIPLKQRRTEENDCGATSNIRLPDSITLVRPGVSIVPQPVSSRSTESASSVADMLATRGITVMPSSGRNGPSSVTSLSVTKTNQVPTSLNSAVSITPAAPQRQGTGGFAVPGRRGGSGVPPLQTVDLTQDVGPPVMVRGPPIPQPRMAHPAQQSIRAPSRAANRARVTCQVCDKIFVSPDALQVHMQSHRQASNNQQTRFHSPTKLPYECKLCTAQYPTMQGLAAHRQKYHQGEDSELALPVLDLKQPGVSNRLHSLGIRFAIPLTQLHNRTDGLFCLPVVPVDSMQNPAVCNIGALGASNLLPLGTMKTIKR